MIQIDGHDNYTNVYLCHTGNAVNSRIHHKMSKKITVNI